MAEQNDTLVGSWSGTVTHDGEVDEYTVTFAEDGSLKLRTTKSTGSGEWSSTGQGSFRFTFREVFNPDVGQHSPNGKRAAYIQIDIAAQRFGSTYTGSGTAEVYGTDGSVIYSTLADTQARQLRQS